jgi:hypothetical protein
VSLALLSVLAFAVLSRRRELGLLHDQIAHAMTLEARQRPLLASVAIGVPQADTAPTIYRAPRRWSRGLLAAGAVPVVAIVVALVVHFLPEVLPSESTPRSTLVPVAIFNATGSPGAAHRLAQRLSADHIHASEVGDINASLGSGVYVLYPPGAASQARRVAALIPNSPTLAPIQPQVQNAVGRHHEIVVIFD